MIVDKLASATPESESKMAFEQHQEDFEKRTLHALDMGGAARVARQRALGRLNARERIDYLCDPGSFLEAGRFATGERPETRDETPADGKVCGYGRVDGREAAIVSHDITVKSASSSPINVRKMAHMRRTAVANGMPLIMFNESSGALKTIEGQPFTAAAAGWRAAVRESGGRRGWFPPRSAARPPGSRRRTRFAGDR